jgi:hypothetical protein
MESDVENTLGEQDPTSLQLSSKSIYDDNAGEFEVEVKGGEGVKIGGREEEKKERDGEKEKITEGEKEGQGGLRGEDELKKDVKSKKAQQLKVEKANSREEHGADIEVLNNPPLPLLPSITNSNSISLYNIP